MIALATRACSDVARLVVLLDHLSMVFPNPAKKSVSPSRSRPVSPLRQVDVNEFEWLRPVLPASSDPGLEDRLEGSLQEPFACRGIPEDLRTRLLESAGMPRRSLREDRRIPRRWPGSAEDDRKCRLCEVP
jgi:hypothetical protein